MKYLGVEDFDLMRVTSSKYERCPVKGCSAMLAEVRDSWGLRPYCADHGIKLHSKTYVYWDETRQSQDTRLRNFVVANALAEELALNAVGKAESHRLGYEMSEDALSWNVFMSLAEAGQLRAAVHHLVGRDVNDEPALYLWGTQVYPSDGRGRRFAPLDRAREKFEGQLRTRFKTEPDIMLVTSEVLVCIEAKFGSGNSLANEKAEKEGEKPIRREGLIARYLPPGTAADRAIVPDNIGPRFHSQLFRNIVFAAEMAKERQDWYVVNLVSSTQWRGKTGNKSQSCEEPTEDVRRFLVDDMKDRFQYRTWEYLHCALVHGKPELAALDRYMHCKSAHFLPAFNLASPT